MLAGGILNVVFAGMVGFELPESSLWVIGTLVGFSLLLGSYGVCAACGQPIPEARLQVMPYAVKCVACAEAS